MLNRLSATKCAVTPLMTRLGTWGGGACAVLLICVPLSPALAQSASFRNVDTNADQVLSHDELVRAFGFNGAARLLSQSDHNGDGTLTISELRSGGGNGGDTGDSNRNDNDDSDAEPNRNDDRDNDDDDDDNDDDGDENDDDGDEDDD